MKHFHTCNFLAYFLRKMDSAGSRSSRIFLIDNMNILFVFKTNRIFALTPIENSHVINFSCDILCEIR